MTARLSPSPRDEPVSAPTGRSESSEPTSASAVMDAYETGVDAARWTPGGLTRALPGRTLCGCGDPAAEILIIQRVKGRSGARTSKSSRIPLCARHVRARTEQSQRRSAASRAAWLRAHEAAAAARRQAVAAARRPALRFEVVAVVSVVPAAGDAP